MLQSATFGGGPERIHGIPIHFNGKKIIWDLPGTCVYFLLSILCGQLALRSVFNWEVAGWQHVSMYNVCLFCPLFPCQVTWGWCTQRPCMYSTSSCCAEVGSLLSVWTLKELRLHNLCHNNKSVERAAFRCHEELAFGKLSLHDWIVIVLAWISTLKILALFIVISYNSVWRRKTACSLWRKAGRV